MYCATVEINYVRSCYVMAAINSEHLGHLQIPLKQKMYHNKPMAFKCSKCFSMLRCGTAPLRIETGRYERLPVEQRVCEVCDSDNVEDEMHLLISCNAFTQERTEFYANVSQLVGNFNELPLEDTFIVLMSDPNICTFTARACHDMFIKHQAIFYQ